MRKLFTSILLTSSFFSYYTLAQCVEYNSEILKGNTVCSDAFFASVIVSNTTTGKTYQAYSGVNAIGSAATGTGGNIILQIPLTGFSAGKHIIGLRSAATVCPANILPSDTTLIVINALPKSDLIVSGDTICDNSVAANITIHNSEAGVSYQLFVGPVFIGQPITSQGGDLTIAIPRSFLQFRNRIRVVAGIPGCSSVTLIHEADVVVNVLPVYSISVQGDTICSGSDAHVIVKRPGSGVSFNFKIGNEIDTNILANGNNIDLLILSDKLVAGNNTVHISAAVNLPKGCGGVLILRITANVRVNMSPLFDFDLVGDTVTLDDEFAIISILPAIPGQLYQAYEGATLIGSGMAGNSTKFEIRLPVGVGSGKLEPGRHSIIVNAAVLGCRVINLQKTTTVLVKPSIIASIDGNAFIKRFNVWPNPIGSEIHIQTNNYNGPMHVSIMNSYGLRIYEQEFSYSEEFILNPVLISGIYFLELNQEGIKERIKLVK